MPTDESYLTGGQSRSSYVVMYHPPADFTALRTGFTELALLGLVTLVWR